MGAAAIPLVLTAAGTAYSAYAQSKAGEFNQQANELMALDAIRRGGFEESVARSRGTHAVSEITAGAAGAGLDVSRGSPVDVVGGTRMISALDVAMIKNNAMREAYGYRVRGAIASAEASNAAKATLITGLGSIAAQAYAGGLFKSGSASTGAAPLARGYENVGTDLPEFTRG